MGRITGSKNVSSEHKTRIIVIYMVGLKQSEIAVTTSCPEKQLKVLVDAVNTTTTGVPQRKLDASQI